MLRVVCSAQSSFLKDWGPLGPKAVLLWEPQQKSEQAHFASAGCSPESPEPEHPEMAKWKCHTNLAWCSLCVWHLVQGLCRPNPKKGNRTKSLGIWFHLNFCQSFLLTSLVSLLSLLGQLLGGLTGHGAERAGQINCTVTSSSVLKSHMLLNLCRINWVIVIYKVCCWVLRGTICCWDSHSLQWQIA